MKYILIMVSLWVFSGCSSNDANLAVLRINPQLRVTPFLEESFNASSSCSASQISHEGKFYILTARHCVENSQDDDVDIKVTSIKLNLEDDTILMVDPKGFKISEDSDIALMPLKSMLLSGKLLLASKNAKEGDIISIVGYPLGVHNQIFRQGIAKSQQIKWYDTFATLVQLTVAPGDSGSAVLNSNGRVIGILVAGDPRGNFMGYIVPVSYIKAFIKGL